MFPENYGNRALLGGSVREPVFPVHFPRANRAKLVRTRQLPEKEFFAWDANRSPAANRSPCAVSD